MEKSAPPSIPPRPQHCGENTASIGWSSEPEEWRPAVPGHSDRQKHLPRRHAHRPSQRSQLDYRTAPAAKRSFSVPKCAHVSKTDPPHQPIALEAGPSPGEGGCVCPKIKHAPKSNNHNVLGQCRGLRGEMPCAGIRDWEPATWMQKWRG